MGQGLKGPWLRYVPDPLPWESKAHWRLARSHRCGRQVALVRPHLLPPSPFLVVGGVGGPLVSAPKTLFLHLSPLWMQNMSGARMLLNKQPSLLTWESPTNQEVLAGLGSDRPPAGHPLQLSLKSGFAPGGGTGVIANAPSLQFSTQFRSSDSVMFLLILKSLSELLL